jgi:hypothetical protein
MEKLALARARVHVIIVKVIANGLTTLRRRLIGHAICFAQQPTNVLHQSFGEAALAAAFENLRVLFVDPSGRRGKLERSALQIPDLRLDAHVLFNALALEHALHGGAAPPTIARMLTLVEEHSVAKHLRETARLSADDSHDRALAGSDIAGVHAAARDAEEALDERGAESGVSIVDGTSHTPILMSAFRLPKSSPAATERRGASSL